MYNYIRPFSQANFGKLKIAPSKFRFFSIHLLSTEPPYFLNFSVNYPCVFVLHANTQSNLFHFPTCSLSHVLRIITLTLFVRPLLIVKTDRHVATYEFIFAFVIALFSISARAVTGTNVIEIYMKSKDKNLAMC